MRRIAEVGRELVSRLNRTTTTEVLSIHRIFGAAEWTQTDRQRCDAQPDARIALIELLRRGVARRAWIVSIESNRIELVSCG